MTGFQTRCDDCLENGLRRYGALVALLIALLGPAFPADATAQSADQLKVVATFSIQGDVVRNIGGDAIDLTVIVGAGGDAHTFEPNPERLTAVADADLIFENGLGFEPWLDDMYEAAGSHARRVVVTDGLPLLDFNGHGDVPATPDSEAGEQDPHVWQDVSNVIGEVATVRDALAGADPVNANAYQARAESYSRELHNLDASIRNLVNALPAEKRILVTSHDSLGYFAHAYGFTIAGTALGSISTEAADPAAGEIADLIDQIKASGVPAIFAENVENNDLMKQIADDAGVELAPELYTDALSDGDGPAATYVALMTYNATTIVTALAGAGG